MTPYLDAGFLLTLLVPADGSALAHRVLRRGSAPFALNFLHQLQAENLLVGLEKSDDPARQTAGLQGKQLWQHYLAEGVFQLTPTDWDSAFRVAITWNNQHPRTPPLPLLLLHPALAAVARATEFLSFDPRSRAVAKAAGLRLHPERL
jgi:hypothetical protein